MNKDVKWISFHGSYDFGYLLKLLTCAPLPDNEAQFFDLLHDFFPALYDIKYLLKNCRNLNLSGGMSLQKVAEHLEVVNEGSFVKSPDCSVPVLELGCFDYLLVCFFCCSSLHTLGLPPLLGS